MDVISNEAMPSDKKQFELSVQSVFPSRGQELKIRIGCLHQRIALFISTAEVLKLLNHWSDTAVSPG